ncbi:hypothetical protein CAP35_07545 [Chitinophagaceae bacterium IBVUCB1]|nr:hypothetical protein CAP35_07545 [Chitinophagaceae bacterium IBVUCB1]
MRYMCLLLLSVALFSCKTNNEKGSDKVITKNYSVTSFTAIDVNAPIDVNIKIANVAAPSVTIKGEEGVVKQITCVVNNGVLEISKERIISFNMDKDLVADITMPSITALTIKGVADTKISGKITGASFALNVKGAGDVEIDDLATGNFQSAVSGAGDVLVKSGSVDSADIKVAGAGDVDAYGLQVKKMNASISGTGDMDITVSETLNASINGAGSIHYKGNPSVTSDINGIGSIKKAN